MHGVKLIVTFLIIISSSECRFRDSGDQESEPPTVAEYARTNGYYAEDHSIITPDGYILTAHRILSPKTDRKKMSPEPFILMHGLFTNSGQWTLLEPERNLAFLLADKGFDIWMGNARGNMYSRKHVSLSPSTPAFWNYSWHEHGVLDLPATIDYVLNLTKHEQVWYSGHSMGTTMFFVMSSMRPEYSRKIKHMYALAPTAYMSHTQPALRSVSQGVRAMEAASSAVNGHLESDVLMPHIIRYLCPAVLEPCAHTVGVFSGYNPRTNPEGIRKALSYFPDAASIKQLAHYGQLATHDSTFRMYDYYEQNQQIYNSENPPDYPVEQMTVPFTFFYSSNDIMASYEDVEALAKNIKKVRLHRVSDKNFNHLDFIVSSYANEVVYNPMIDMIDEFRANPEGYFNNKDVTKNGLYKKLQHSIHNSTGRILSKILKV